MIKKLWVLILAISVIVLSSCASPDEEQWDTETTETIEENQDFEETKAVIVYVCGEVNKPGVYSFIESDRVFSAIEAAGGFTDKAAVNAINQARLLEDGEKIYIPCIDATDSYIEESHDGLVNINTASKEELMSVNGIGESRAISIIEYRKSKGSFKKKEDIMQVSGIKSGLYEKIKEKIKVE